jgi:hypothetical protein
MVEKYQLVKFQKLVHGFDTMNMVPPLDVNYPQQIFDELDVN